MNKQIQRALIEFAKAHGFRAYASRLRGEYAVTVFDPLDVTDCVTVLDRNELLRWLGY